MSRSNYILVGSTMIGAGAVVGVWYKIPALIFVGVGLMFVARLLFLDWKYGEERPTKRQIGAMPLEEYRKKIRNPKRYRNTHGSIAM